MSQITDTIPSPPGTEPSTAAGRRERGLLMTTAVAVMLAVIAMVAAGWVVATRETFPGDDSADAGFARDMSRHHAQAVQMAGIVYQRTEDPAVRLLAYDILTTQQAQIGTMGGWLSIWDLPYGSLEPPMAWMGHTMHGGAMPGLATEEELASLETLPPAEMDRTFLQLMIRHHQGGVEMENAARARAGEPQVRRFAELMAQSQVGEVATMQQMLAERAG